MQRILTAVFLTFVPLTPSLAQDGTLLLRAQLEQAKRKIEKLEKLLQHAEDSGFHSNLKTINSGVAMIRELPKELLPKKSGRWTNADLAKVNQFLTDNFVGRSFAYKAKIESRSVYEDPAAVKDKSKPKFKCYVEYANLNVPNSGFNFNHHLGNASRRGAIGGRLTFSGNKEYSKTFMSVLRPKKFFVIQGQISSVSVRQTNNQLNFDISLSNRTFVPPEIGM